MTHEVLEIDEALLEKFEQTAIRRLIRKLDWRLLPYLFFIEIASYINRIDTSHAKLMDIKTDRKLNDCDLAWGTSLFFLAYSIFVIPSNIIMRYIGPTGYLSLSMITWGSLTIGMAFIKSALHLKVLQFLLGVTQAGFFPSMIIYFSLWYRKRDQTMRIAFLVAAAIFAAILASLLAFAFKHMDGIRGLHGWQWMFLLEGLPMIPLGLITFLFLSNVPTTVQWLNNMEKQLLTNMLRNDAGPANRENVRFSWRQAYYVLIDIRVWLYALIAVGNLGVIKYLNTYFPVILEDTNSLEGSAHLIAIPPYILAFICCLLVNYSSARRHEFGLHIMFCLAGTFVGFLLMILVTDQNKVGVYVGKCITCACSFAIYPLIFSWLTNNVSGHTKRSVAVGFVIGLGQIGGIILPLVNDESTHQPNHIICAGAATINLILTIVLRICLMVENRRRDRLTPEQRQAEAAVTDPCDWHPEVRYIL